MSRPDYGVAVAGGGPAGLAAAIALARTGARVILFEARTYPHDKLCGEFLSPECAGLLEGLGMGSRLRALHPARIEQVSITAPDGRAWHTTFPAPALGLTRRALDAALAEHAAGLGVTVCEGTEVTGIKGDLSDGFTVTVRRKGAIGEYRAAAAIAAQGKRAPLDRALDRPFLRKRQPFMALKAHFRGPALPGRIQLHGFRGGYCGMSEVEEAGLANVCLLAHESVLRQARRPGEDPVASFLAWMQAQNPALDRWLSRAEQVDERWLSIAQVPFVAKDPVQGDLLFCGDAAGLIVPLAGDGIAMALQSGQMAAGHVAAFLVGGIPPGAAPRQYSCGYAGAWRRAFEPRLRLGRLLQVLMLHPRLLSLGLALLSAAPALGSYVVNQTRDLSLLQPNEKENVT